jgi:hypothetical protein
VLATDAGEFQPARGLHHTAWERNTPARPGHYDVYARAEDGSAFKVNAAGTGAANGGISGDRLVYQQFRGRSSDLKIYDLGARQRRNAPRAVNTRAWEYWPSISGARLLFGRLKLGSGARAILLYNTRSRTTRRLAGTRSEGSFLAPGQVNGNYAVWAKCTRAGCAVFRYNALTKSTTKLRGSGSQHAPSVTRSGTVFYARSRSSRCGSEVRLVRAAKGRRPVTIARLPDGHDVGDTYAYSDPFGNSELLHDDFVCDGKTGSDIYERAFSRSVTLSVSVRGDGRVTSSSGGIDCPGACTKPFRAGSRVTLRARGAFAGASFVGWTGACSGTAACTVTLGKSKRVAAAFETAFELSVSGQGSGTGTVRSDPAGIDCGDRCSFAFTSGAEVVLTADADRDSAFSHWEGDCTGTAETCRVSMIGARNATAVFELLPTYELGVGVVGAGSGAVTSRPRGIDCPGRCTHSYVAGTSVKLSAAPDSQSIFVGWGGACGGTGDTCTVTLDGARLVVARFDPAAPPPPAP